MEFFWFKKLLKGAFLWRHFHDPVEQKATQAKAVVCISKQRFQSTYVAPPRVWHHPHESWHKGSLVQVPSIVSCIVIRCHPWCSYMTCTFECYSNCFTLALCCPWRKIRLMTLQDRSHRTCIYWSCIVSAQAEIQWASGLSLQHARGTHFTGPSPYQLPDAWFIYGPEKFED